MQINIHALIYANLHPASPAPGQGPLGVCTKIGHLSHMMSRGRGYIIDEPKQHVSVSTYHPARHMGGSCRRWAERAGISSPRRSCVSKARKEITACLSGNKTKYIQYIINLMQLDQTQRNLNSPVLAEWVLMNFLGWVGRSNLVFHMSAPDSMVNHLPCIQKVQKSATQCCEMDLDALLLLCIDLPFFFFPFASTE